MKTSLLYNLFRLFVPNWFYTRKYKKRYKLCNHEWREFGTRIYESVSVPVGRVYPKDANGKEIRDGCIVCDKCGCETYGEYTVKGTRPTPGMESYNKEFIFWVDVMVDVIKLDKKL